MDIASDPNMYVPRDMMVSTYKVRRQPIFMAQSSQCFTQCVDIGTIVFIVLHQCLSVYPTSSTYDAQTQDIVARFPRLSRMLWSKRILIASGPGRGELCQGYSKRDMNSFSFNAFVSISLLIHVYMSHT